MFFYKTKKLLLQTQEALQSEQANTQILQTELDAVCAERNHLAVTYKDVVDKDSAIREKEVILSAIEQKLENLNVRYQSALGPTRIFKMRSVFTRTHWTSPPTGCINRNTTLTVLLPTNNGLKTTTKPRNKP